MVVISGRAVEIGGQVRGADRLAGDRAGRARDIVATISDGLAWILIVGGAPLGPRLIDWNFVASSARSGSIARARAWKAQTFPLIPPDHDEHIPYPELHTR